MVLALREYDSSSGYSGSSCINPTAHQGSFDITIRETADDELLTFSLRYNSQVKFAGTARRVGDTLVIQQVQTWHRGQWQIRLFSAFPIRGPRSPHA